MAKLPQVPFGAVYFRKSNPPQQDWERDYKTAAEDGLNVFRHWFMWSAIERAPGKFDWDDYDRQLDLAAKHGIVTIIAELSQTTPDWAVRKFADARQVLYDGRVHPSIQSPSSATGGFSHSGGGTGTLTLNAPEVRAAAHNFLTTLARRYKGHPALLGYDVWNECNYSPYTDYGPYTVAAFRDWLKRKYGTLDDLARAWHRYSYAEWEDIEPPTQFMPYCECLDWLRFKQDNHYEQMQFRIDAIRAVDPDAMIVAHGTAGSVTQLAQRGSDDWRAASKVETYGYTWVSARKGTEPWKNFFAADLVRGAARGKTFWHAERQGGPLWLQPQVLGRDKDDGRVATPEDIRLWSLSSFAGGARGMMNLRFRPLLDGPLFGAFGSYDMAGQRTPRSDMAASIARWANAQKQADLMNAAPVTGDIGIIMAPEAQEFAFLLNYNGKFDTYSAAMWGAYRGFFDNNIQADWVHIDDIESRNILYFPYPIMLLPEQAEKIANWVRAGGTLICEACPGYFGPNGRAGTMQPNLGLDTLFGAEEVDVECMPDIADRNSISHQGHDLTCAGFRQAYRPTSGTALATFDTGQTAIVENRFGAGRTMLIGSHLSASYHYQPDERLRAFFRNLLTWAGHEPAVSNSNPRVQARLHGDGDRFWLWLVNPERVAQDGRVSSLIADVGGAQPEQAWGGADSQFSQGLYRVPAQDALVVELPPAK